MFKPKSRVKRGPRGLKESFLKKGAAEIFCVGSSLKEKERKPEGENVPSSSGLGNTTMKSNISTTNRETSRQSLGSGVGGSANRGDCDSSTPPLLIPGGHRDQWGASGFAHEAGGQWGGLLRSGAGGRRGKCCRKPQRPPFLHTPSPVNGPTPRAGGESRRKTTSWGALKRRSFELRSIQSCKGVFLGSQAQRPGSWRTFVGSGVNPGHLEH